MAINVRCDRNHSLFSYKGTKGDNKGKIFWRSNKCKRGVYTNDQILKLLKNNTDVIVRCTDEICEDSNDKFECYLYEYVRIECKQFKCYYEYFFIKNYGLSSSYLLNICWLILKIPSLIFFNVVFPNELLWYLFDYYLEICIGQWWKVKKMEDIYQQLNSDRRLPYYAHKTTKPVIHCCDDQCHNIYLRHNGIKCLHCEEIYCPQEKHISRKIFPDKFICNDCISQISESDSS
jgi:hypothetical protein